MVDASLRATILELLWKMNQEQGISLVYVTHDLTTAHQVAETILVLYGGQIMEIGSDEAVIHAAQNPYTQALIAAVPLPDPSVDWQLGDGSEVAEISKLPAQGCAFAPRCPQAMKRCHELRPPLFQTANLQAAACWLAEGAEVTTVAEIQRRTASARQAADPAVVSDRAANPRQEEKPDGRADRSPCSIEQPKTEAALRIIDSHCHIWQHWPYQPPVPDPGSRALADQLLWQLD